MLSFRPLVPADQQFLWHWLHVALWDPPPAGMRPVEVLQLPGVRIYAEDWGRPGDVGVVAQVDGVDAGACWMRLVPDGMGLAYVDEHSFLPKLHRWRFNLKTGDSPIQPFSLFPRDVFALTHP